MLSSPTPLTPLGRCITTQNCRHLMPQPKQNSYKAKQVPDNSTSGFHSVSMTPPGLWHHLPTILKDLSSRGDGVLPPLQQWTMTADWAQHWQLCGKLSLLPCQSPTQSSLTLCTDINLLLDDIVFLQPFHKLPALSKRLIWFFYDMQEGCCT